MDKSASLVDRLRTGSCVLAAACALCTGAALASVGMPAAYADAGADGSSDGSAQSTTTYVEPSAIWNDGSFYSALADTTPVVFQVDVEGTMMYFTVMGDQEVSVGRNNVSKGTDYAIDESHEGDVTIPRNVTYEGVTYLVTSIQDYAFSNGTTGSPWLSTTGTSDDPALGTLYVPASVTSIGDHAFCNCTGIRNVEIASGSLLTTIDTSAFIRCRQLESFVVPASVETIGNNVFQYCNSLASCTFEEGSRLSSLGVDVWACSVNYPGSLEEFEFPAVEYVPDESLKYQTKLTTVTFAGSSYTHIGARAFQECTGLTEIEFPKLTGYESGGGQWVMFETQSFTDCTSLKTVAFSADADDIGLFSGGSEMVPFYGCTAIENVVYFGKGWSKTESTRDGGTQQATMFPSASDVHTFYRVQFFRTAADAASGQDAVGCAYLRSDVKMSQINDGSCTSDQLLTYRGEPSVIPTALGSWAIDGLSADDTITSGCKAYDAGASDIASAKIELSQTDFLYGIDEIALTYNVTSYYGDTMTEGTDFEVAYFAEDGTTSVSPADGLAPGTYIVRFTGIGSYSGTMDVHFYVVKPDVASTLYAASDESGLVSAIVQGYYTDDTKPSAAMLVGDSDARYLLGALPLMGGYAASLAVTGTDALSDGASSALRYVGPSKVYIYGSTAAVSASVVTSVTSLLSDSGTTRIAGSSMSDDPQSVAAYAFVTSSISAKMNAGTMYLVASDNADLGVAIATAASRSRTPVLFASGDGTLTGYTRFALKTSGCRTVTVVTDAADPQATLDAIEGHVGNDSITYTLVSGEKETLLSDTATSAFAGASRNAKVSVVLAPSGSDRMADQVVAAWYAGLTGSVLMLVDDDTTELKETLHANAASVSSVTLVGLGDVATQEKLDDVMSVWSVN